MLGLKRKKQSIIDLMRDKEVVYRVTIDPKFVQFESASKDWLVRYSAGTFAAGMVNYLVANKCLDELTELVRAQYLSQWMFRDARIIKEQYKEIERAAKREALAQKTNQSDAEILAEQKALHEKTPESIKELETIKKEKK